MGLLILFGIMLGLGIILLIGYHFDTIDSEIAYGFGLFFTTIGCILLFILLMILINIPFKNAEYKIRYVEDRAYIESVYNNTSLSESERNKVTTLIREKNQTINKNKVWRDNFWVGIYNVHDIGDLETFDVAKVPQAIPAMTLEMK